MIIELGHFALILAFAVSIVQFIVPLCAVKTGNQRLFAIAPYAAILQAVLVTGCFAALTFAFARSDFSVALVYQHSHSLQPFIYKLTSVWGNHEGSMLLWVVVLSLFGGAVALIGRDVPRDLRSVTLAFQGLIAAVFIGFILFTSNPFLRQSNALFEGKDLNPILQDPGLAIHPPMLYLGYVGFSICFSFAAAALLLGRVDNVWARYVRPWALGAWIFLTLGIAMGSYWAYYILGWGGWWFWDPVENASLMPWLAGTAFLHSAIVMEKRGALKVWTILLAILTFSLSLMGTFIVRSGILTSVHTFASDPARGVFILAILVLFVGGSLALFAWRAPSLAQGGLFAPVSREGALVFNNLFLSASCLAVLVGTLYPLLLEAITGDKISVGPPFFVATMLPLTIPLALAMPFGQNLAWKRGAFLGLFQRLALAIFSAVFIMIVIFATQHNGPVLAPIGLGVGFFLGIGSFADVVSRSFRGGGFWLGLRKIVGLPLAAWGTAIAHFGVALFIIGVSMTAYDEEKVSAMNINDSISLHGYRVTLTDFRNHQEANYREAITKFDLASGGVKVAVLEPSKRTYIMSRSPTSQTARYTTGFSQIYVALGDADDLGATSVRAYWKPFVLLIWFGPAAMALGGLLSLLDRRLRIGVAKRVRGVKM
jgi:cytochrome c-type biogenesis protein CcmF